MPKVTDTGKRSINSLKRSTSEVCSAKRTVKPKRKKGEMKRVKTQHEIDLETRRKEHEKSVKQAREDNLSNEVESGEVTCSKLQHRFAKGVDKKWPFKSGYKNVNCCSSAPGIFKQLSPMKLGPIRYEEEEEEGDQQGGNEGKVTIMATNLENLWQFSKVWQEDIDPKTDLPNSDWYKRRKAGFLDQKPHRHVNRHKPRYAYWKGQKLNYMESRRRIYCPLYAQYVVETEAYKKLHKLVTEDKYNVNILGYDGFDYESAGMTLQQCFNDTSRPFGHELVLCCLLKGERPWEEKDEKDKKKKKENTQEKGKERATKSDERENKDMNTDDNEEDNPDSEDGDSDDDNDDSDEE